MLRLTRRTVILTLLFASASLACLAQVPTLASVRKVYVEPMENHLDQYLTSEISRQFHGSLQIVTSATEADAVLKGVNLGAQSTNKATVNLVDPTGKIVLWSGTAGDREGKFLDVKHGGLQSLASHLIHELHKAMESR